MSNLEVVVVSLFAVFGGLGILTLIISMFPLIFRTTLPKPAVAPAPAAAPAAPQLDEEELAIVMMAAIQAYEEETANCLARNWEG